VLTLAAAAVAAVVALPVLSILASLIGPPGPAVGHLASTILGEVVRDTLVLVLVVGCGTLAIGAGTAWLVSVCRFPGSRLFAWALVLPMAMPAYIIGYVYTNALAFPGPVQTALREAFGWGRGDYWFPDVHSVWGAGVMLTLVLYPYVYLLARTAFLEQSAGAIEAARTLGRGPWAAFRTVALPLARPALAAGVALALMETLADFGTVDYFGVRTFTTTIYRTWIGMGDRVSALQFAAVLVLFALALLAVELGARGRARHHRTSRRQTPIAPFELAGWRAGAAAAACAAPVLLGFLVPVLLLLRLHLADGDPLFGARFLGFARNSFLLAGAAAVLITAVALLLAYALRLAPSPVTSRIVRAATLGYAVPGTVIAVGVLFPLGAFDQAVDAVARAQFGVSTGLLLSGTVAALLFAYLVRFLAVAHGAVEAGFARIPRSVDDCARTLGAGVAELAARVHAPLMRRSLLTAALVVFVDVLKELPATLIVRPFDFDTLAVRVYQLAADERLGPASTASLVIVAIGLVPVILLTRMIEARRTAPAPAEAAARVPA
jgi:iron(III) transport system permease protein